MKTNGNFTNGSTDTSVDNNHQIRELELELAQTKLALVEAECKNQVFFFFSNFIIIVIVLYYCINYSINMNQVIR